jgi:hypothetical protein
MCVKENVDRWAAHEVILPADLFYRIIALLDAFDIEDFDSDIVQLYGYVVHSLNKIKHVSDLKHAFNKFFYSDEGHRRFAEHMNSELVSKDECVPF